MGFQAKCQNLFPGKNKKKYFNMSAENFTKSAKRYCTYLQNWSLFVKGLYRDLCIATPQFIAAEELQTAEGLLDVTLTHCGSGPGSVSLTQTRSSM